MDYLLFKGPMIRPILDGRKTQTRRVAKRTLAGHLKEPNGHRRWHPDDPNAILACPYGQPGDRLWVREKHARKVAREKHARKVAYDADGLCGYMTPEGLMPHGRVLEADGYAACFPASGARTFGLRQYGGKWRPSIHMPRWASRITLEITGIRVEWLREITPTDALAEGVAESSGGMWSAAEGQAATSPQAAFALLWDSINAKRGYGWDVNPLVWVIEFEVVK